MSEPTKSSMYRTEDRGLWLDWKLVLGVLAFFVTSGALWTTLGLAKLDDIQDHDSASNSHLVKLPGVDEPSGVVPTVRSVVLANAKVSSEVEAIKDDIKTTHDEITQVRSGVHEQRAEDLAYRSVDKLPKSLPTRERIERFNYVKTKAIANLEHGRNARDGLDDVVGF